MPLPLPNLDDRTYADLIEEARALIPGLDRSGPDDLPSWTNHNPSDPGITLIELFAWLTEQLIYRTNRVTDHQLRTYLRLLNGPGWEPADPSTPLEEEIRSTILAVRRRVRAVTSADYEQLARDADPRAVARAKCIPRRDLAAGTEAERLQPRPGHVSVVIVPDVTAVPLPQAEPGGPPPMFNLDAITLAEGAVFESRSPPRPSASLRQAVWLHLDPWRVLTTRHHVVGPIYAPVNAELLIARRPDWPETGLADEVVTAIAAYLDPVTGGPDKLGWPFGRSVYVSELYALLQSLPGVDHVPDIALSSQCPEGESRCVAAAERYHDDGDQIGLDLAPHHLPWALIDPLRVVISTAFVAVQVSVTASPTDGTDPAAAHRAVKQTIRDHFHPLHGGPNGTRESRISTGDVRGWLTGLHEIDWGRPVRITLQSDPAHTSDDPAHDGEHIVSFASHELADVQITVTLGSAG